MHGPRASIEAASAFLGVAEAAAAKTPLFTNKTITPGIKMALVATSEKKK